MLKANTIVDLRRAGFTLIELSIVLVIVGLVVSGIMVGKEMYNSAKVRQQVSQLSALSTATNAFKLKYSYLPADIPSPSNYGLWNTAANFSHRGDGNINDNLNAVPINRATADSNYFFVHLSQAGFIDENFAHSPGTFSYCDVAGSNKQFPRLKIGEGGMLASSYRGNVWWFLGLNQCACASGCSLTTNDYFITQLSTAGVISPQEAYGLDSKLDDGLPGTGTVLAVTHTNGTLDTTDDVCVTNSDANYYTANPGNQCRLYIKAN